MRKLPILFVALLSISACTTAPVENKKKERTLTVVSSGKPVDVLPAFTTFSWNEDYAKVLTSTDNQHKVEIEKYIKQEIIEYLGKKGFVFEKDPIQADVILGFLFSLGGNVADSDIQKKFGLLPGISKRGVDVERYIKSTLILAVLDNRLKKVYWRSATQGFVDKEKDRENLNEERFQFVLDMMMREFPKAGQ